MPRPRLGKIRERGKTSRDVFHTACNLSKLIAVSYFLSILTQTTHASESLQDATSLKTALEPLRSQRISPATLEFSCNKTLIENISDRICVAIASMKWALPSFKLARNCPEEMVSR